MFVEKINSISGKIASALNIQTKQPEPGREDKELTNASKFMLGATALTAATIAGLAIRHRLKLKHAPEPVQTVPPSKTPDTPDIPPSKAAEILKETGKKKTDDIVEAAAKQSDNTAQTLEKESVPAPEIKKAEAEIKPEAKPDTKPASELPAEPAPEPVKTPKAETPEAPAQPEVKPVKEEPLPKTSEPEAPLKNESTEPVEIPQNPPVLSYHEKLQKEHPDWKILETGTVSNGSKAVETTEFYIEGSFVPRKLEETFDNGNLIKKADFEFNQLKKEEEFTDGKLVKSTENNFIEHIETVREFDVSTGVRFKETVYYDKKLEKIKDYTDGKLIRETQYYRDEPRIFIDYDAQSGAKIKETFHGLGMTVIDTYAPDGKMTKHNVFCNIDIKEIKAAEELDAKYAALSDTQLRAAYDAAAPEMPELEYKIIKKQMDRMATVPDTFKGSAIEDHHALNGRMPEIRAFLTKGYWKESGDLEYMPKYLDKLDNEWKPLPPLEKDCTFWRGSSYSKAEAEIFANAKAGDVVVPDAGYSYTGFHGDLADSFCRSKNGIIYEIRVPKGAKVSRNSEHGGEAIMPRGAQYKLISQKPDPLGRLNVVLEYILPS